MDKFDTSTYEGRVGAIRLFNEMVNNKQVIVIKKGTKSRSNKQNGALHLYFKFISDELQNLGTEFTYNGIKGYELSMPYTPQIVKEFFWKPIQLTLFELESTKDLTTQQMNQIIEIINKFFADKGVVMSFPNIESLMDHEGR